MKVTDVTLDISAVKSEQFPDKGLPEIVLSGRSNVGKSSLINTLLQRKNLAHTSSQPGKTQTLNFYQVNHELYLVDVPGYGYAKVSKQQREAFGKMIETYLTTRRELKGAIILCDGRHLPTEDDKMMFEFLTYYNVPLTVVATKMDKLSANRRQSQLVKIRQSFNLTSDDKIPVLAFSSLTNLGREEVWQQIIKLINRR